MVTPRGQTGPLPTTGAATGAGALPFSLLLALVEAIEARTPFVRGSARDVALYAVMIARALGLAGGELGALRLAALLRDVGMLNVPEAILHKKEALSTAEQTIVRQHPMFGAEILSNSPELKGIAPTVLRHHEDYAGGGYPGGISRELIPLGARIIRVADTYDALTALRPYRSAHSPAEALRIVVAGAGVQFDPEVVDAFQSRVGRGPATDELLGGAPGVPAVAGPRGATGSLNLYRAAYYATEALKALTNGASARLEQAGADAGRTPPDRDARTGNGAARPDEPTATAAAAPNRTRTLDS